MIVEILLWVLCITFVLPLVFVVINSFKDFKEIVISPLALPSVWNFRNYTEAWKLTNYTRVFLNTLEFAGLSTLVIVVLGSMAGYKLSRTKSKWSTFLFTIFLIAMMVPFQTIMVPVAVNAKKMGLLNNVYTLFLINAGISCSLAVLLYHGFTKSIPREIEESAYIDGCSSFRVFFSIIFPLLKPITSTVAVIYMLQSWNKLELPLIIISNKLHYTIPLSQMAFFGQYTANRWNLVLAAGVMACVPVLLLFVFCKSGLSVD